MGAGASFDVDPSMETGSDMYGGSYFCHQCRRPTRVDTSDGISCSTCLSTFVEEMPPNSTRGTYEGAMMLAGGSHSNENSIIPAPRRYYSNLSDDQNRRLANAAIMLRLLEAQLRDELDNLQMLQAQRDQQEKKIKPLTTIMKRKLREIPLSLDQICSQPSCPICSEDFVVDETTLCLPCSHLFHKDCVMQWLESKKTCPICRYEMTNSVSTIEELERLTFKELVELLEEIYSENDIATDNVDRVVLNVTSQSHRETASIVHQEMEKFHQPIIEEHEDSESSGVRDTTSMYDSTEFSNMIRRHLLAMGPSSDDRSASDNAFDDSMPSLTYTQPRMLPRLIVTNRPESLNAYDSSGITGGGRTTSSYAIGNTYVLRSDGRAHVVSTPETRMAYQENRNNNDID